MIESRVVSTNWGSWAEPAGGLALKALLAEYERVLVEAGAPIREGLAPGLGAEEIAEKLLAARLRPNEEIIAWFEWQNGVVQAQDGPTNWHILPDLIPESLDDLIASYEQMVFHYVPATEYMGNVMDPRFTSNGLGFGWLPLESDNYPRLAVYCLGAPDAIPLVRTVDGEHFNHTWDGRFQAVSLCTPVTWWIEGIASGEHVWDAEAQEWLDPDYSKMPESQKGTGFF
jgi:hypothetical protein